LPQLNYDSWKEEIKWRLFLIFQKEKRKKKQEEEDLKDLDSLLKRARHLIKNEPASPKSSILRVASKEHLIRKMEGGIAKEIISRHLIDSGLFLCGLYASRVIVNHLSTPPESWVASDYFVEGKKSGNGETSQTGADVCFLICCLFPERGNWRLMNLEYYQKMGTSFYYRFYQRTGREIGYHTSDNFDQIVRLTSQSVRSL